MSGNVRIMPDGMLDEDQDPFTLKNIGLHYLFKNLNVISDEYDDAGHRQLKEGIIITNALCESFISDYRKFHQNLDDTMITMFRDTERTPLRKINLRDSSITKEGVIILLGHELNTLSLWYCNQISLESYGLIGDRGQNLQTLELVFGAQLRHEEHIDFQLNCPNLRHLALHSIILHPQINIANLNQLNHLDLTSCKLENFNMQDLCKLPNLRTLILFEIWPLENHLDTICQLSNLETLNIAIEKRENGRGTYDLPDEKLAEIIKKLPNLRNLDISGTNLAGNNLDQILGLERRRKKPLKYLGLYGTDNSACTRPIIPAIEIAGEGNEEQLLTAALYNTDRPLLLAHVFRKLYESIQSGGFRERHKILEAVLAGLDRHLTCRILQLNGSLVLYEILKKSTTIKLGTSIKNHINRVILFGMEMFNQDYDIVQNGLLVFSQFPMFECVIFEHERLIGVILHGLAIADNGRDVQELAVNFLYYLCFRAEFRKTLAIDDLGVVRTILSLIAVRLQHQVLDDVMKRAWFVLWEVILLNPNHSQRFLDANGLGYLSISFRAFTENMELVENVLIPLFTVTEHWKFHMMRYDLVEMLKQLSNPYARGFEVSHWATGILCQILSEGPGAWSIQGISREDIIMFVNAVFTRWDLNSERSVDLNNFHLILSFLRNNDKRFCQYWAVWTLANLTTTYPNVYCRLVQEEIGIEILNELVGNSGVLGSIRALAERVINNCG